MIFGRLFATLPPLEESTEAWEVRRMYSITGVLVAETRLALQLLEDDMIDEFKECFWEKEPPQPW